MIIELCIMLFVLSVRFRMHVCLLERERRRALVLTIMFHRWGSTLRLLLMPGSWLIVVALIMVAEKRESV